MKVKFIMGFTVHVKFIVILHILLVTAKIYFISMWFGFQFGTLAFWICNNNAVNKRCEMTLLPLYLLLFPDLVSLSLSSGLQLSSFSFGIIAIPAIQNYG